MAARAIEQRVDDQTRPFVSDTVKRLPRFTVLPENIGLHPVDSVHS